MRCVPHREGLSKTALSAARRRSAAITNAVECRLSLQRRSLGFSLLLPFFSVSSSQAVEVAPVDVRPELAPDPSSYDAADPQLRAAARRLQDALDATDLAEEEQIWTEIIETYGNVDAPWRADVVGRAFGNRGNARSSTATAPLSRAAACRSRRGAMKAALEDFSKAIEICPWSVDPVLNRGVVLESIGQFDAAIRDYRSLLKVAPYDPAVWNNLGNAYAGKGDWQRAASDYGKATRLAPDFVFARANYAVALYETGRAPWLDSTRMFVRAGEEAEAARMVRGLLRRYPEFTDMRAAQVAILWLSGNEGEAETEWLRVQDPRYSDPSWLVKSRRWPPKLAKGLTAFLELKSVR